MSVSVEVRGADKVIQAAEGIPKALRWTLARAFERALTRYKLTHQAKKMRAPPPPLWKGRSPLGPGVLGTREHAGMTGFLRMFKVFVKGDNLNNMEGRLYTVRGMIAYRQEFGGEWAPGRIPLPPAKDRRGRLTERAKRLWKQRDTKLVKLMIRGKEFWFLPNPAYAKEKRRRRKFGAWGAGPSRMKERFIPMFHVSAHRLRPRLAFYKLWKAFIPQAKKIFIDALRFAVARAKRRST